jgi:hypothetical protein
MKAILEPRITKIENKFSASCACGKIIIFSNKAAALKMLSRGSCRNCTRDYRSTKDSQFNIYQNSIGKWCSRCSGCDAEQAYTRKDHAKQSEVSDWQCKKCVSLVKGFSENKPIGNKSRLFNKFRKSAINRGICWELSKDQMFANFDGMCRLTGWQISIEYSNLTASLDRINSDLGYVPDNIQWVHAMVNMSKNKYTQQAFVDMCKAIADKH